MDRFLELVDQLLDVWPGHATDVPGVGHYASQLEETKPQSILALEELLSHVPEILQVRRICAELDGDHGSGSFGGSGIRHDRQRDRWRAAPNKFVNRGDYSFRQAMATISTRAPRGRLTPPITDRAGGASTKKRP